MSEYLPVTADEVIEHSLAAHEAGAAVLHLHARDEIDADDVWWIDYDALDLSKADRFGALDRASHFRADFGIRAQIARLVATKPGLDCGLLWEGFGIAFVGTNRTSLYP